MTNQSCILFLFYLDLFDNGVKEDLYLCSAVFPFSFYKFLQQYVLPNTIKMQLLKLKKLM